MSEIDERFRRDVFSSLPMTKTCVFCERLSDVVVHAFCVEGHCERRECVAKCESCQEWFEAIEPVPVAANVQPREREEPRVDDPWTIVLDERELELARELAGRRDRYSAGASNTRVWRTDHNMVGVVGEIAFARLVKLPVDEILESVGPDGGLDIVYLGLRVNVKTSPGIGGLMIPAEDMGRRRHADVYVHGVFESPGKVSFQGWETHAVMRSVVPIDRKLKSGEVVPTHQRRLYELRPMRSLEEFARGLEKRRSAKIEDDW